MPKPPKTVICTLCTEKKYVEMHKCTFDIFEIEHRMKKVELEEQFNKEVKQGWRFAADAANSEDCNHTSDGVFVTIDSDLGDVVDKEEGAVMSCRSQGTKDESPKRGLMSEEVYGFRRVLLAFRRMDTEKEVFMEVVVELARTTGHPWLMAGDANMDPTGFICIEALEAKRAS